MTPPPLWALALTLAAYAVAMVVWQRGRRHPLLNPTLLAIILVAGVLVTAGVDVFDYQRDAGAVHLLLGPAVVALAVPIHRHAALLRARAATLVAALLLGSAATIAATIGIAAWLGVGSVTLRSLAPKSATTAVSMAISTGIGGGAALTAVVTILAGIAGAVLGPALLDALGIRDPIARGFGIGVASHGIGTARAFQDSEAAGTASGLAMGLNAVLTAALVPLVLALVSLSPLSLRGDVP
ncbi:LrgB family protein [Roseomonas rosulenta]|uniref:LrgB family protein n=1 Tax=Roseomonas rosulenta TaxID=2748667 RepID=UPI0018E04477|nr:LrgB family protein [Roseomonas rosulenta]